MGNINERNAQLIMHLFQLQLHFLAHLQIQGAQRLVQQQDLRLIDQRAGNGDPLLLSAGQGLHRSAFKTFQVDQVQDLFDFLFDDIFFCLLLPQAESDVLIDIHMGEQGISLEDRINRSLIRRQLCDIPAVQEDLPLRGQVKAGDHTQSRSLSAAGRAQESHEFAFFDFQIKIGNSQKAVLEFFGQMF